MLREKTKLEEQLLERDHTILSYQSQVNSYITGLENKGVHDPVLDEIRQRNQKAGVNDDLTESGKKTTRRSRTESIENLEE